jgi:protocatechuate 3,4-dioxygenase, beta subunit
MQTYPQVDRRSILRGLAASGSIALMPGLISAEEFIETVAMTEGPFYPDKLPLDTDNDLLIINDKLTAAVGEITHLTGKVLDKKGKPVRNALVEIWQCDQNGAYLHSGTNNADQRDKNFQGYGRFLTDSEGRYYFRTIKPVPYPGRTPHIHFAVSQSGTRILTTQMLIKGHEQNERDGIFRSIRDEKVRNSVLVDFQPYPESKIGELKADFAIVLGKTFDELEATKS